MHIWKILGLGAVGVFLMCSLLIFLTLNSIVKTSIQWNNHQAQGQATRQVEDVLTSQHSPEAEAAIEKFQRVIFSLESYQRPEIRSEVATTKFLQKTIDMLPTSSKDPKTSWFVISAIQVKHIRVAEYTSLRMRVVARVYMESADTSPDGKIVENPMAQDHCRLYVFERGGNEWKVSDFFDVTRLDDAEREWAQRYPELKETFGKSPDEIDNDC